MSAFPLSHRDGDPSRFPLVLTGVYLGLAAISIFHHEMWGDELNVWLMGKQAASLSDLYRIRVNDGHPLLWYAIVYMTTRVSSTPVAMQVVHLAGATVVIYLVARFAPFAAWQKAMLAFGYFFFFEYAVISRDYMLTLLAAALLLIMVRREGFDALGVGLSGLLLMQTTAYGLILASFMSMAYLMKKIEEAGSAASFWRSHKGGLLTFAGLTSLGILLSVLQLVPPADSLYHPKLDATTFLGARLLQTCAKISRAYLPFPEPGIHFWGGTVLDRFATLQAALSVVLFLASARILRHDRFALVFYVGSTLSLLAFGHLVYGSRTRHDGFFFIAFVLALWMAGGVRNRQGSRGEERAAGAFLAFVLAVQVAAGAYCTGMQVGHPFSMARPTARFIEQHGLQNLFLVGDADYAAVSVGAWLNRPMYHPVVGEVRSYCSWDGKRRARAGVSYEQLFSDMERIRQGRKEDILLVLNYFLPPDKADYEFLGRFDGAILPYEQYALYRLRAR